MRYSEKLRDRERDRERERENEVESERVYFLFITMKENMSPLLYNNNSK